MNIWRRLAISMFCIPGPMMELKYRRWFSCVPCCLFEIYVISNEFIFHPIRLLWKYIYITNFANNWIWTPVLRCSWPLYTTQPKKLAVKINLLHFRKYLNYSIYTKAKAGINPAAVDTSNIYLDFTLSAYSELL